MAGVRIKVESGPDEGLEVSFGNADVRIGRGAGANVPLTDQGVMGSLRVWFDGVVYKATNEIDSTTGREADLRLVTVEGDEFRFPARETTVWYAGFRIRLTDETCLLLATDPDLVLPDGRHTVARSRPLANEKKQRDLVKIALIVVLFGGAAAILSQDTEQTAVAGKTEREVGDQFRRVEGRLQEEHKKLGKDQAARPVATIQKLLRDARFAEVSARRAEAAERYVVARDELNRFLGPPDTPPPSLAESPELLAALREVRGFVSERLIVLKEFIVRERNTR